MWHLIPVFNPDMGIGAFDDKTDCLFSFSLIFLSVRTWSSWSEWSACSSKCVQMRRRVCRTHLLDYYANKNHLNDFGDDDMVGCSGKDFQTIVCRGGDCRIDNAGRYLDFIANNFHVFFRWFIRFSCYFVPNEWF